MVRSDLNGYSEWVRDIKIPKRVALLDEFFSHAAVAAHKYDGVYYRDEGDCIVVLFTPYFFPNVTYSQVISYAKEVTKQTFGNAALTCKTVIAGGPVTFYQKGPDIPENDWSAEGDAFVTAARLESAVESQQTISCLSEDYEYDDGLKSASEAMLVSSGQTYYWSISTRSIQVQGLKAAGGWVDVTVHSYVPGGKKLG